MIDIERQTKLTEGRLTPEVDSDLKILIKQLGELQKISSSERVWAILDYVIENLELLTYGWRTNTSEWEKLKVKITKIEEGLKSRPTILRAVIRTMLARNP